MNSFRLGAVTVDLEAMIAQRPDEVVLLTPTECRLLAELIAAVGQPVARGALLERVWGYAPNTKTRTLFTTTHRLRAKLESDPKSPQYLLTRRGKGLALVGAEATQSVAAERPVVLFGRDGELERGRSALKAGRPVVLQGPLGVGTTAIARALAEDHGGTVVWVDVSGCNTEPAYLDAIANAVPGRCLPDPAAIRRHLGLLEPVLVVLDDVAPHTLDEGFRRECLGESALVVTTTGGVAGHVVRVAPFDSQRAVELLRSELDRLDQSVPAALIERAAARTDGLPLEIVWLAPLLGLFGEAAFEGPRGTLHGQVDRAVSLLDASDARRLSVWSAFAGGFGLQAAAFVAECDPSEAMHTLTVLLERGLVFRQGAAFRLLGVVRRALGSPSPASSKRLVQWCANLATQTLFDSGQRILRHRTDVQHASTVVTRVADARGVGLALFDLVWLAGPHVDFTQCVGSMAERFPEDGTLKLLWRMFRVAHCDPLNPEERTELIETAEGGCLGSIYLLWVAFPTERDRWCQLVWGASAIPALEARIVPLTATWFDSVEIFRQRSANIRAVARRRGWTWIVRRLALAEDYLGLLHGRGPGRPREDRPMQDIVDSQHRLIDVVRMFELGRVDSGLRVLEPLIGPYPALYFTTVNLKAIGFALLGEDAAPILAMADRAPNNPFQAQVHLAIRKWLGEPVAVDHPGLQGVLETGRPPQPPNNSLLAHALAVLVRSSQPGL